MRKIPTLFVRDDADRRHVLPEVTPGCEWVAAGEGYATRKYDGTCVMFDGARWWARREVKPGKETPEGFVGVGFDEATGKAVGWMPVEMVAGVEAIHADALAKADAWHSDPEDNYWHEGTYELCGPKVNGNPEGYPEHLLVCHACAERVDAPRDFEGLASFLASFPHEGLVWHHEDGRMAKIKRRDFPTERGASL